MRAAGIGARFRMLRDRDPIDPDAIDDAIRTLREDLAGIDGVGPPRVASFLAADSDDTEMPRQASFVHALAEEPGPLSSRVLVGMSLAP